MRLFILISLLAMNAVAGNYNPQENAQKTIDNHLKNLDEEKHLLMVFGANWCENCSHLGQLMNTKEGKAFFDAQYDIVHVDIGRWNNNMDIDAFYGYPSDNGIPGIAILNNEGELLHREKAMAFAKHYRNKENLFEYFTDLNAEQSHNQLSEWRQFTTKVFDKLGM